MYRTSEDLRRGDARSRDDVFEAVRFSVGVSVAAVVFLVAAAMWIDTCGGSTFDTVACGAPQRTLLALGAPLILLAGGLRAFVRSYQSSAAGRLPIAVAGRGLVPDGRDAVGLAEGVPFIAVP